jgi:murein DD-endopeptidase MepM/ murein hydrolase activator NlpD
MHKTFLRTPVQFTRVSSHFNLKRKHPILNRIIAHRGVDYAAPSGQPVKTTGDGVVKFVGRKGGYGKTVIIQHGKKYTTLYGHLSGYAKGLKKGRHVQQGQIVAYVGMTGLATGPHLHYEFRVNGVHRNPLTVELPKALKLPDHLVSSFEAQTGPLLAQLSAVKPHPEPIVVALNKKPSELPATP